MFIGVRNNGFGLWLSLSAFFLMNACQNEPSKEKEKSLEVQVSEKKNTLKEVHFDCGMVMGNDKMLYLKYNNSATGLGPVISCALISAKDFHTQKIPAAALAACTVRSAVGNEVYYTIKEGDALLIFKGAENTGTFNQELLIPLL
jgi:hypothetical protein